MHWPLSTVPWARRSARQAVSIAVAALLASACSDSTPNDRFPANLSISPNVGYPTQPVAVVITGTGFLASASQSSGSGDPTLDTRHRAWLGTNELEVSWRSTTRLDATVPAGLEPGTYALTVENALGNRGELEAAYTVLPAPIFSATASVDQPAVNIGQPLTLTLTVTNNAPADVTGFALVTPTISSTDGGSASPSGAPPGAPSTIATGETRRFTWTYIPYAPPGAAAHISIAVSATGVDSASGKPVTAAPPVPVSVTIQQPAALDATWTVSQNLQTVGQAVTVTLLLSNRDQAATAVVTSVAPSFTPSASATCTSPQPEPSPGNPMLVAGGKAQSFTWTCTAWTFGSYTAGAEVAATDSNDGKDVPVTGLQGVSVTFTQQLVGSNPLTVKTTGKGTGTVTCNGGACAPTYPYGSAVQLAASPGTGSTFAGWSGDCSGSGACTVTMTASRSVTARFTRQKIHITVSSTGG